jgi:hypothetical protein
MGAPREFAMDAKRRKKKGRRKKERRKIGGAHMG